MWHGFYENDYLVTLLKQTDSDLVRGRSRDQTTVFFLKLWITSFWTQILHLNFKKNVEKMVWYRLQHIWA